MYAVVCREFPAGKTLNSKRRILSILRRGVSPIMGGKIVDMEEIEIEGNFGLRYTETSVIAGSNLYYLLLLVEDNLFQMSVTSISRDVKQEAEEFYNNFELH